MKENRGEERREEKRGDEKGVHTLLVDLLCYFLQQNSLPLSSSVDALSKVLFNI